MFKQAFAAVQASVVHLQGVPLGKRFALVPLGPPLLTYSSTAKVGECGWVGVGGGGGGARAGGPAAAATVLAGSSQCCRLAPPPQLSVFLWACLPCP